MKKKVDLLPFGHYLQKLNSRDLYPVFEDFLTICVCCLSNGKKEDEYLKVIKKYSTDEINLISSAFASMVNEADNNGKGFKDPFGDFFEEHFSDRSNKGQFFTPEGVCDLMSQITGMKSDRYVNDPCCGSGRLLLSHAKNSNREEHFYIGADISFVCCQMTLINLCLNSMRGEVIWGNSLISEVRKKWLIIVDDVLKYPFIYEVQEDNKKNEPEEAVFIEVKPEIRKIEPVKTPEYENVEYLIYS